VKRFLKCLNQIGTRFGILAGQIAGTLPSGIPETTLTQKSPQEGMGGEFLYVTNLHLVCQQIGGIKF
jgi:hypothetical protein